MGRSDAWPGLSGLCLSAACRRQECSRHRRGDECGDWLQTLRRFLCTAASNARYAVERGDWKGAAELQVQPTQFAYVDAVTHFARALGAARSGTPDAAKADMAKLAELRDKLRDAKDAYWSEVVDIQRQVAAAWVLNAEGKHAEALNAMGQPRMRRTRQRSIPSHPGRWRLRASSRRHAAERGMAKEALAAFEATMAKEPNRYNGLGGSRAGRGIARR